MPEVLSMSVGCTDFRLQNTLLSERLNVVLGPRTQYDCGLLHPLYRW